MENIFFKKKPSICGSGLVCFGMQISRFPCIHMERCMYALYICGSGLVLLSAARLKLRVSVSHQVCMCLTVVHLDLFHHLCYLCLRLDVYWK